MADEGDKPQTKLQVVLLPFLSAGHMLPILDTAEMFATNQVKAIIITTPLNAPTFTKALESTAYEDNVQVEVVPFPSKEGGIPEGIENCGQISCDELFVKFIKALDFLQDSLEQLMLKYKPNCLVADTMYTFATEVAVKFKVPRLMYHVYGYFPQCVGHSMKINQPQKSVLYDDEEFVVPGIPHEIPLTKSQLSAINSEQVKDGTTNINTEEWKKTLGRMRDAEVNSYGNLVNTFYELEPEYADYYTKVMGKKTWHIGPVSLYNICNGEKEEVISNNDEHDECLKWLDCKKPNSVVYVCFGSLAQATTLQLQEIARGLEASEQDFIWVVKKETQEPNDEFERRMEGKGLIIRGWAPQKRILNHEAIGAFVTHCGWNSIIESISCGVPMVTWPVFAEQFFNEKLVTRVLRTGVGVGAKKFSKIMEGVKSEDIKEALTRVMVGEEAMEMRSSAKKMKELATKAVEVGGSSYCEMNSLIQELSSYNAAP